MDPFARPPLPRHYASHRNARGPLRLAAVVAAVVCAATLVEAQQPLPQPRPFPAPKATVPPPPATAPAPTGASSSEAALQRRIEQLEEQLVDMQVVIGTLESMSRGGGAPTGAVPRMPAAPSSAVAAADAGRLDALETQISALASQIEQLQGQMRALISQRGGALDPPAGAPPPGPAPRPGFGSLTVSPDAPKDDIGRVLATPPPTVSVAPLDNPASEAEAAAPKQLYEQAYGYLLQRDYAAAESAFVGFLRRYPNDALAGNAQYWLGETHYVRGQYRAAANAFLKGYQDHARSAKAPESLLKLAMSLQRLGQKDAACSSYSELMSKFPNAPAHVKNTANTERQRGGC
jgi:tol-pal system protein YbgF